MTITIPAPDGIDAAGRASVVWVPAIADTDAPTVAEITAGTHLSCAIDAFPVAIDVPTSTRTKYCMKQPVQSPGKPTFSVGPLVADSDPQGLDATGGYDHQDVLVTGAKGFLLDRRGLDFDAVYAAGQKATIYPATVSGWRDVDIDASSTDGQKLQREYHFAVTGQVKQDVEINA